MVGKLPSSSTDMMWKWEHFSGVFVFEHGLLSRTSNFAAIPTARSIMYSTPRGLPALVAAGRRQYLLPLLPPRGNIVWLVEMCQMKQTLYILDRYQCDDGVKPLD